MHIYSHIDIMLDWVDHQHFPPGWSYNGSGLVYVIWLVLNGEITVTAEMEATVTPGMCYLFAPCQQREFSTSTGAEWLSVGFHPTTPATTQVLSCIKAPWCWELAQADFAELHGLLALLVREYRRDAIGMGMVGHGIMQAVFGLLWRQAVSRGTTVSDAMPEWLTRVLQTIEEHPDTSVTQLAEQANYSIAHFRAQFQHYLGISPHRCLQRRQLQRAQTLLEYSNLAVVAIAEQLGFDSPAYFTRFFTCQVGMSPTQFRQSRQQRGV